MADQFIGSPPRPRRHLPSTALAQAKSLLKLQSYASFDISDLSGHQPCITTSPSAPSVGSSSRRLPSIHFSHSDLMMASDFTSDEIGGVGTRSMLYDRASSVKDSPKLSSSRKLPAPPISAFSLSQTRRLLPRPVSCDVPDTPDAPGVTRGVLSRPFSFDFGPPLTFELDQRMSDGLIRQTSTSSCPALVRPCVSPRSPKFLTADTSVSTTPSPHPADPDAFVPSGILVPLLAPSSPALSPSPRPHYRHLHPFDSSIGRVEALRSLPRQASLPPNALDPLAARRQRYHGGNGSLSSSIQESSYFDFDSQRPSRSRHAVRNAPTTVDAASDAR